MLEHQHRTFWMANIAQVEGRRVGCYCPDTTLYYLREEFGEALECDDIDKMIGYGDRQAQTAESIGIPRDSPVVLCAYRREKEQRPKYEFRILMGDSSFITGHVNRGGIRFEWNEEFELPESVRKRIESFLDSIRFGLMSIYRS